MTVTFLAGLTGFAFVSSITPGPNNLMLMASGANFGLRRSVPHMLGVSLGFGLMVLLIGWGVAGLMAAAPGLYLAIKWLGGGYLVYLAWKIGSAKGIGSGAQADRPQTFLQAAAFQWVNPKAWGMALGAVATYVTRDNLLASAALVALIFTLVNAPCIFTWAAFGVALQRGLTHPAAMRAFNIGMAALLLLSLYPLLVDHPA